LGNELTAAVLTTRPLTAFAAGALTADIVPRSFWQGVLLLEHDFSFPIESGGALTTAGDLWTILLRPPNEMAHYVFYPVALRATILLSDIAASVTLFENEASFSVDMRGQSNFAWDAVDLTAIRTVIAAGVEKASLNINPIFHGFPPDPGIARDVVNTNNSLAGINLKIDTFDATSMASVDLHIDCRFLAFPEAVVRSAGFYSARMFFKVS